MNEMTLGWVSLSNFTEDNKVIGTIFLVSVVGGVLLRHRGGKKDGSGNRSKACYGYPKFTASVPILN